VFVVDLTGGTEARDISTELRRAGMRVDRAYDARSARAQMKAADRSGALLAVLVGEQERAAGTVTVRQLRAAADGTEAQRSVPRAGLVGELRAELREAAAWRAASSPQVRQHPQVEDQP
jgi:histidyl-tRNA synthetase